LAFFASVVNEGFFSLRLCAQSSAMNSWLTARMISRSRICYLRLAYRDQMIAYPGKAFLRVLSRAPFFKTLAGCDMQGSAEPETSKQEPSTPRSSAQPHLHYCLWSVPGDQETSKNDNTAVGLARTQHLKNSRVSASPLSFELAICPAIGALYQRWKTIRLQCPDSVLPGRQIRPLEGVDRRKRISG
jgi:hypothetical protein